MLEDSEFDKKSLRLVQGNTTDWAELAKDCVCFANGKGGTIYIGVEDDSDMPPADQRIKKSIVEKINQVIPQRTINVGISATIQTAPNGGEFIEVKIYRSTQTIASTSDGKYYMRIADECKPLMPDEMIRVAAEKQAFVWEEKVARKVHISQADGAKLGNFLSDVRNSERVSGFVKEMSQDEMLEYYFFTSGDYLTNLGVLWIGQRKDRALMHYSPAVQFIKYDENGVKVNKRVWDDYTLNPKELLNEIITGIPDWGESIEIADGIFRRTIPNYNQVVIRELIANALVHRVYTMRGDIFINLYHDRLEIHSPGLLPLGVTPSNIISKSIHRNTHLAKVFYDLMLMEKEGSGYDKVYEVLLLHGKPEPIVEEWDDRVVVTVMKNIISTEVAKLMSRANDDYGLNQKEIITLGLIAQHGTMTAIELSKKLNVRNSDGLAYWLGKLLKHEIIHSKGKTKGTEYHVNPELLRQIDFKGKTDLKKIEPHRLQELILMDLETYPGSSIGDINERIGPEINRNKVKRKLAELVDSKILYTEGVLKGTRYFIDHNQRNNE
ncbi:ATP-binding protein [Pontibacter sp. BT731]|uniref:ATP-binding protein n=1 Tax=Pontibacter coccineus TaxID=3063328 RepID=UPI0026E2788A|nr:ATP-binding protein [Pontibacter sp. BT731]MDO6390059.1 ATP-binding protein [Pontibacter sp. BT731]